MGYSKIRRASLDDETVFGTDQVETYLDLRMAEGTFDPQLVDNLLRDPTVKTYLHEEHQHRLGSQFGSGFQIQAPLMGLAGADVLNAAATYTFPQAGALAQLLRRTLGGSSGGAGSTTADVPTTTDIRITDGHISRFEEGACFGVDVANDGRIECRRIIDEQAAAGAYDSLIPHMAFSAAPAAGRAVYNGEHFYLDEDGVGGDTNSLVWRILGHLAGDQWLFRGCCQTLSFTMGLNGLLMMNISVRAATKSKTSGETLAGASYDDAAPLPVKIGEVQYGNAQTSATAVARNLLTCESFEVDLGLEIVEDPSIDGIETVKRWRMNPANTKVRLVVRAHNQLDQFHTDFDARQNKSIGIQIGNTVGASGTGIVYFHFPRMQFASRPALFEEGGFVKTRLEFDAMEDLATGLTTDIGKSKASITLF